MCYLTRRNHCRDFYANKKHYSWIVQNEIKKFDLKNSSQADFLLDRAQNLHEVKNIEEDLIEVIKYGAKMLSDPNPQNKKNRQKGDLNGLKIYAAALHTIYKAMKKHRLYDRF